MLIDPQFRTDAADKVWSDRERLARMAEFEAALALAQAECGVIPADTATAIAAIASTLADDPAVPGAVFGGARNAGNPAIPFVKAFTAAVRDRSPKAARFVHFGSTSQDVIDTALMMGLARIAEAIEGDLDRSVTVLRGLAQKFAETPM